MKHVRREWTPFFFSGSGVSCLFPFSVGVMEGDRFGCEFSLLIREGGGWGRGGEGWEQMNQLQGS